MFEKTYSNGDKIVIALAPNGRKTIRTLNDEESYLLGSVVKMPKTVTVNGTVYTHIIGGKWALTSDEHKALSAVSDVAAKNIVDFNAETTASYNSVASML